MRKTNGNGHARGGATLVAGGGQRRCPDIALAGQILGWSPKVGLREGLGQTIGWFVRQRGPEGGEIEDGRTAPPRESLRA